MGASLGHGSHLFPGSLATSGRILLDASIYMRAQIVDPNGKKIEATNKCCKSILQFIYTEERRNSLSITGFVIRRVLTESSHSPHRHIEGKNESVLLSEDYTDRIGPLTNLKPTVNDRKMPCQVERSFECVFRI